MSDAYLSQDKARLAALQRARRAKKVRIDYMPCPDALAVIRDEQAKQHPGSVEATNSAVLDSIVIAWAQPTGISDSEAASPKTPAPQPELRDTNARTRMTSEPMPELLTQRMAHIEETRRVPCGAKRHRDGQPCQAQSEPGKRRCRFHGGRSTGPKTEEGRQRALANLRQTSRANQRDGS